MNGLISALEPMGLMDGPGIRFVVFMQGCKLRCVFCHNPESRPAADECQMIDPSSPTPQIQNGHSCAISLTADELMERILHYRNYYEGGGVTFSGGEPLLQPDFLLEMLKKCHAAGLHTAIDTAGVGLSKPPDLFNFSNYVSTVGATEPLQVQKMEEQAINSLLNDKVAQIDDSGHYAEILANTDLVLLDIKAYRASMYQQITGHTMSDFYHFVRFLNLSDKPVWLRQVIIPGVNDTREYVEGLKNYAKIIKNTQKIELLPYHLYGVGKYQQLNLPYPLEGVPPLSAEKLAELQAIVL